MKVLSWNINHCGSAFSTVVDDIISNDLFDLILFQECDLKDSNVIPHGYFRVGKGTQELKLYCKNNLKSQIGKIDSKSIDYLDEIARAIIFTYKVNSETVLIVGIHFPSKLLYNEIDQYKIAVKWRTIIQEYFIVYKATEILIFGDFNLNPFNIAMNDPTAFNGLPLKGKHRGVFINSMWNFFGSTIYGTTTQKAPGTFKFNSRKSGENLWNVFDGVIFTNGMIQKNIIDLASIKILENTPKYPLYTENKIHYSDHLPISFNLQ